MGRSIRLPPGRVQHVHRLPEADLHSDGAQRSGRRTSDTPRRRTRVSLRSPRAWERPVPRGGSPGLGCRQRTSRFAPRAW